MAQAAAAEIPILSQGSVVCVLPDEDYLRDGGAAFWIAKVEEAEETDTGGQGFLTILHFQSIPLPSSFQTGFANKYDVRPS